MAHRNQQHLSPCIGNNVVPFMFRLNPEPAPPSLTGLGHIRSMIFRAFAARRRFSATDSE